MQHTRAELECGIAHIEGLSVHKVWGCKGKKLSWESKQDHIRKALKTVSKHWGFWLETKGNHCGGRENPPCPRNISFFQRYTVAKKASVKMGFKFSAWSMFMLWSHTTLPLCLAPSSLLWRISSLRRYLFNRGLFTKYPISRGRSNFNPREWILDKAQIQASGTSEESTDVRKAPFHSVQCHGCKSVPPKMPRRIPFLILMLLLFHRTIHAQQIVLFSPWCKTGERQFNLSLRKQDIRLLD